MNQQVFQYIAEKVLQDLKGKVGNNKSLTETWSKMLEC